MTRTVFYSWQSDLPNPTNRNFIKTALEKAAKDLTSDDTIAAEVQVDEATRDIAGMPNIVASIYQKIDQADAFVCDITYVGKSETANGRTRWLPNPNVLIELGYAKSVLGEGNMLMIFNEAYGPLPELPFDLDKHRARTYSVASADPAASRDDQKKTLQAVLKRDLAEILVRAKEKRIRDARERLRRDIDSNEESMRALKRRIVYDINQVKARPNTDRRALDRMPLTLPWEDTSWRQNKPWYSENLTATEYTTIQKFYDRGVDIKRNIEHVKALQVDLKSELSRLNDNMGMGVGKLNVIAAKVHVLEDFNDRVMGDLIPDIVRLIDEAISLHPLGE